MSDFTVEHVREFFTESEWGEDYDYDTARFPDGIGEFFYGYAEGDTFTIILDGTEHEAKVIEKFDDNHSWTNHKHIVFQVEGRFFKFPGVFYSHDGDYWEPENITEGKPVVKEVIVYE